MARLRDTGQQQAADDDKGEGCSYLVRPVQSAKSSGQIRRKRTQSAQRSCKCADQVPASSPGAAGAIRRRKLSRGPAGATDRSTRQERRARAMGASAVATVAAMQLQVVAATPVDVKGKGRADSSLLPRSLLAVPGNPARAQERRALPEADAYKPGGLPAHYEYRDGEWVYSEDWSLNGRTGNGVSSGSQQLRDGDGANTDDDGAHLDNGDDTSDLVDADDVDDSPLTSLGWARPSNNVLGVDIVTDLADPTTTATSTIATYTTGFATERSNLATLTSSSAVVASTPSSRATTTSRSSATSSSSGQTYDFRRDVPDGWVSDGRTAAYAVPVIVGLSIFLSCLIFSLLVIFVRATTSRRARRKQRAKLQEEGRLKKLELPDENGNFPTPSSACHNQARASKDFDEKAPSGKKKIRIARRWTPSQNGALRRRKKDIARLFNRSGHATPAVVEIIEPASPADTFATNGSDQVVRNMQANASPTCVDSDATRDIATRAEDPLRRSASRSSSALSEAGGGYVPPAGDDLHLSRTSSTASRASSISSASTNRRSPRPSSIRLEPPVITATAATDVRRDSANSIASPLSASDSHAVPLPTVGPPAYMHPPSPAYTRDSYLAVHGASAHPSSAVSTPGLPSNLDEKRLLLAHQAQAEALPAGASSSSQSDPYREQRRYEHLYASREGEAAAGEQRTGAPAASMSRAAGVQDTRPMTGHIAIDDKAVLAEMQQARSAPAQAPAESVQEANAPSLQDAEFLEDDEQVQAALAASQEQPASRTGLPLPPRALPFASSAATAEPMMDEKARLRAHEEARASSYLSGEAMSFPSAPSAPPAMAPSAPPLSSSPLEASAPSAPVLEDAEAMPEPSAPVFTLEDEDELASEPERSREQDNRPFREGVL